MKTILVGLRKTTDRPPRTLRGMTENGVSTTRILGDGRRMPRATGPEMVGEMSWRSRLEGAKEE